MPHLLGGLIPGSLYGSSSDANSCNHTGVWSITDTAVQHIPEAVTGVLFAICATYGIQFYSCGWDANASLYFRTAWRLAQYEWSPWIRIK